MVENTPKILNYKINKLQFPNMNEAGIPIEKVSEEIQEFRNGDMYSFSKKSKPKEIQGETQEKNTLKEDGFHGHVRKNQDGEETKHGKCYNQ